MRPRNALVAARRMALKGRRRERTRSSEAGTVSPIEGQSLPADTNVYSRGAL